MLKIKKYSINHTNIETLTRYHSVNFGLRAITKISKCRKNIQPIQIWH